MTRYTTAEISAKFDDMGLQKAAKLFRELYDKGELDEAEYRLVKTYVFYVVTSPEPMFTQSEIVRIINEQTGSR